MYGGSNAAKEDLSMKAPACKYAIIAVFLLGAAFAAAEKKQFWEAKPYTEWSEKEVDKMLKDSPWAKTIPLGQGPMSMGGGSRGSGEEGASPAGEAYRAQPKLVITWYARPIREALARRLQLHNPSPPKDQMDRLLLRPETLYYDLLITGSLPPRLRGEALEEMKEGTYLQKKNKTKVPLAEVIMPERRGDPMVLRFARGEPGNPALTLEDREVTLVLKLPDTTLRTTFKLNDMAILEKVEL